MTLPLNQETYDRLTSALEIIITYHEYTKENVTEIQKILQQCGLATPIAPALSVKIIRQAELIIKLQDELDEKDS